MQVKDYFPFLVPLPTQQTADHCIPRTMLNSPYVFKLFLFPYLITN